MDKITLYAYRYRGGPDKEQIYITIDCKNKEFETNIYQNESSSCKYGFSSYELKDYSELEDLLRCLEYKGFNQTKRRSFNEI